MRTGFNALRAAMEQASLTDGPDRPIRIYGLFPHRDSFSTRTADYEDAELTVAAVSVRQAYAVAHKRVWIDPDDNRPVGVVCTYDTRTGVTLWCGCSGHHVTGGQPPHGSGIRALRAAVDAHRCDDGQALTSRTARQ